MSNNGDCKRYLVHIFQGDHSPNYGIIDKCNKTDMEVQLLSGDYVRIGYNDARITSRTIYGSINTARREVQRRMLSFTHDPILEGSSQEKVNLLLDIAQFMSNKETHSTSSNNTEG